MSSILPAKMRELASTYGYRLTADSRGFIFNAGLEEVISFLDIGTSASTSVR
jgi:hypothetical protein